MNDWGQESTVDKLFKDLHDKEYKSEIMSLQEQLSTATEQLQFTTQLKDMYLKDNETLGSELGESQVKIKDLNKELDFLYLSIENYQKKTNDFENIYFGQIRKEMKAAELTYKKLFEFTLKKMHSLIVCPLTLDRIDYPAILNSGHTIEQSFMDKLIQNGRADPFDRSLKCDRVIVNRTAIELKKLLEEIELKTDEIEGNDRKDKSVQVSTGTVVEAKANNKSKDELQQRLQDLTYKFNLVKKGHKDMQKQLKPLRDDVREKDNVIKYLESRNTFSYVQSENHLRMSELLSAGHSKMIHLMLTCKFELAFENIRFLFSSSKNLTVSLVALSLWKNTVQKLIYLILKSGAIDPVRVSEKSQFDSYGYGPPKSSS
jgi:chaperonin cofactor prefoldin